MVNATLREDWLWHAISKIRENIVKIYLRFYKLTFFVGT